MSRFENPLSRPLVGPRDQDSRIISVGYSIRHTHILHLHDLLLHLLSLPPSYENSVRTLRTWRCLAKIKEIEIGAMWMLGCSVLDRTREEDAGQEDDGEEEKAWRNARKAEWLLKCQADKLNKLDKFQEYILCLVAAGRATHALDELSS